MCITAPFIYAVLVPVILLDLVVTVYQAVCFPLYGIPKVKRKEYIRFGRGRLSILNVLDIWNCTYCSYVNGVIAYAQKITGETERMWCPIKHAIRQKFAQLPHRKDFVEPHREVLEEYYKEYEKSVHQPEK
jgi:hypothetical protein